MSYNSETIEYVLDKISDSKYVFPAIQREFVWSTEQIEKLFDSLMRGYPIGSFLFWEINKDKINDYQFYEFIKDYHEKDNKHNKKHSNSGKKEITAILDGQQRLTSLYIGLKGSYSEKISKKRINDPNDYPEKFLYLNIAKDYSKKQEQEVEAEVVFYEFKFKTEKESKEENKNKIKLWFKVGEIFKSEEPADIVRSFGIDLNDKVSTPMINTVNKLKTIFTSKDIINYYKETTDDIDKVLNIFTRINSGGTTLNYSDLLLSTATAIWQGKSNFRDEINKLVNDINEMGFNINKDFIMKSLLVLSDLDIAFKVKNFNSASVKIIEENWSDIKNALLLTISLVKQYGYRDEHISSYNALLPIAYYIKKNKIKYTDFLNKKAFENKRNDCIKCFSLSLIGKVFSGSSDTTLKQYREVIEKNKTDDFPLEAIKTELKDKSNNISFTKDRFEIILDKCNFKDKTTFSVLLLLQDTPNGFDLSLDHIHPKSKFNKNQKWMKNLDANKIKDIDSYKDNICNLQILTTSINSSKSDKLLTEWVKESDSKKYSYLILETKSKTYEIDDCIDFWNKRRKLLLDELCKKFI